MNYFETCILQQAAAHDKSSIDQLPQQGWFVSQRTGGGYKSDLILCLTVLLKQKYHSYYLRLNPRSNLLRFSKGTIVEVIIKKNS